MVSEEIPFRKSSSAGKRRRSSAWVYGRFRVSKIELNFFCDYVQTLRARETAKPSKWGNSSKVWNFRFSRYLDDVFPGRKLIPQDPYKKALDKVFRRSFLFMRETEKNQGTDGWAEVTHRSHFSIIQVLLDSFTYSPIFKAYFNKDEYAVGFDEFWSNANVIEAEMKKRGQKFLGGLFPTDSEISAVGEC